MVELVYPSDLKSCAPVNHAPDCKSVHPGSILVSASILTGSVAIQCLERNTGSVEVRGSNPLGRYDD